MAIRWRRPAQLLLCCALVLAATAHALDDFGQHIVEETVDLSTSHSEDDVEQTKDMESLLHWAIEHSDPEKLREHAANVEKAQTEATVKDFVDKQKRVRELTDYMNAQLTETDIIKAQLEVLKDSSSTDKQLIKALTKLQVLVEPIDNANDLKPLAGMSPLVQLLSHGSADVREAAAYALGTAAANNEKFQGNLFAEHPGVVKQLLKVAGVEGEVAAGAANKALYALGSLVRTLPAARAAFYDEGGMALLLRLMNSPNTTARVKSKGVNLASDLMGLAAKSSGEDVGVDKWTSELMRQFASAALELLQASQGDLQRQETALLAMRQLLILRGMDGKDALDDTGAETVLREVLTQLELEGPEVEDEQQMQQEDVFEGAKDGGDQRWNFARYVTHLCADILHYLSIEHEEL